MSKCWDSSGHPERSDEVQEKLNRTLRIATELFGFVAAKDAFLVVLKTKTYLLNAAQDIERRLREQLAKEKESYVVDVQNVTTHMAADIERHQLEKEALLKEKEDLAYRLQATERKFLKVNVAVKVFGEKVVTKFMEDFCLAQTHVLEKTPEADLSELIGPAKIPVHPSWCDKTFLLPLVSTPSSPESGNDSP